MIYNIVGLTGLILVLLVFVVLYITRPTPEEMEDDLYEIDDMSIDGKLCDISIDLGNALDDYIINRCMERAKYFGRKVSDMADFNSVIYELGLDNKLISELLTKIEGKR